MSPADDRPRKVIDPAKEAMKPGNPHDARRYIPKPFGKDKAPPQAPTPAPLRAPGEGSGEAAPH